MLVKARGEKGASKRKTAEGGRGVEKREETSRKDKDKSVRPSDAVDSDKSRIAIPVVWLLEPNLNKLELGRSS